MFYVAVPRYDENAELNITMSGNVAVIPAEDSKTKADNNADETLIELVFQRPAIWNYKLPIQY